MYYIADGGVLTTVINNITIFNNLLYEIFSSPKLTPILHSDKLLS